jgi:hypothetical protein
MLVVGFGASIGRAGCVVCGTARDGGCGDGVTTVGSSGLGGSIGFTTGAGRGGGAIVVAGLATGVSATGTGAGETVSDSGAGG